jgi:hypothetical protein
LDECFTIIDDTIEPVAVKLTHPRYLAASVVLNGNTLWLTGGKFALPQPRRSTEFVQLTGTTPGPELPKALANHWSMSPTNWSFEKTERTKMSKFLKKSFHEFFHNFPTF